MSSELSKNMASKIMVLILISGLLLTGYSINKIANGTKTVNDVEDIERGGYSVTYYHITSNMIFIENIGVILITLLLTWLYLNLKLEPSL